ncbi:MAG TPA: hypothetical protein ENJ82_15410 [Bacteroidetes bacterium]|nr:hypothetical protein [Bacteroidota bacterium]
MASSGPQLNVIQVIGKSFGGMRSIAELKSVRRSVLWQGSVLYLVLSISLLLLVFATSFPYEEASPFLFTVPCLPLIIFVGTLLVNVLLQVISSRESPDFARIALVAGHLSLMLSLLQGIVWTTFSLSWGSMEGLLFIFTAFLVGISWTALQLHHHWTELLGISGAVATFFAGIFVAMIQSTAFYLWVSYIAVDYINWDVMQFLS